MFLKSGSAARFSLSLLFLRLFFSFALTAQKVNPKEGHVARVRSTDVSANREKPNAREEWFLRGRRVNGRLASELLLRAQQQRDARRQAIRARQMFDAVGVLYSPALGLAGPGWTELGPSPLRSVTTTGDDQDYGFVTGRVTSVAVDQSDLTGNTVYIGAAYGGVWKSTNAASPDATRVIWTPMTDDQPTLAVGAISIDPSDHNVLLVGTGEANSSADSYYGLGILRSNDGGNSWTLIPAANGGVRPFHGLAFAKIAFNSNNPNIVVAATAAASEGVMVGAEEPPNSVTDCANSAALATCRGLYYSLDAGQSWYQATMTDGAGAPDNESASDVVYNAAEQKFYAWSRGHGIYTSLDGVTFTRAADQGSGITGAIQQPAASINLMNCPSSPANVTACPVYRGQITVVPGRDEMYVWFVDSSSTPVDGGIFGTTDGGRTWTTISVDGIENCGDPKGCGSEQGGYDLALTALPAGQATDLYAGAVNIYRCQVTANNPTCSAQPFVNLTHVYGCAPTGSFSKVHPDQHALDFLSANPNIIYFGNDGGVYRTLASQNGTVVPTSCPANAPIQPFYPFDNLNGTMGSITQFVWFQQHPTNQYTLLGGTQGKGSAAIDSADSGANGLTWRSVLGGDGGWTDINPNNPDEWFAENTRLDPGIQRCGNGTNCTGSQFVPVITAATVGRDSAAFYMPLLLDPQNSAQIVLGTCRVWRVPSSGVNPPSNALSPNFDGSAGSCPDDSTTFVSALAVGGPQTANGSQVIYAGTEDGRVWTTQAADRGSTSWSEVSPVQGGFQADSCSTYMGCQYPVSGIAIDPRDSTGKTAYVTAMGFQIGHVWQTTNGGGSWTDISGNLPDAPTNSVAVDGSSGTIYVATDTGVYATSAAAESSTQWTEVGPAAGQGTLPNVAVTRVAIFNPPGQPSRLRAATYGRGMWEMPLAGSSAADYELSVSNADLEAFPGQAVTYNGSMTGFNGYDGTVTLSCAGAGGGVIPTTCTPSTISGGIFTVTASNSTVQDFSFRIQGTDGTLVRQATVSLRVVDFSVGMPSPASVVVTHGNSTTTKISVTSLGSFDKVVSVDCDPATVPSGVTCTASPATLSAGGTQQITVTIATTVGTAAGTYAAAIRATSSIDATHATTHEQTVQVQVTAQAGFTFDASSYSAATLKVGQTLSASITLAPHDGYTGSVNLICSASGSGMAVGACSVNPAIATVDQNTVAVPLTITLATSGGSAVQQQVLVSGADGTTSNQVTLPFLLTDFGIGGSLQPENVSPGATDSFTFQLTPLDGYSGAVNLVCNTTALGQVVPCSFDPPSPTLSAGKATLVTASIAIPAGTPVGAYSIVVSATDATFPQLSHSQTTGTFLVQTPDFSFSLGSSGASVSAGSSIAPIALSVQANGGFTGSISWGVAGCPQLATCTLSPGTSLPGQPATLTITTTAPSVSSVRGAHASYLAFWIGLPFGTAGLAMLRRKAIWMIVLTLLGLAACGGGSGGGVSPISPPVTHPGTPAGTYTIVITGTSTSPVLQHSQNFTLTVQ